MSSETLTEIPYAIETDKKMKTFWEGLNQGELKTTRCTACAEIHFPPRSFCPKCYSDKLEWTALPLHGVIETFTFVEVPPTGFNDKYYLVAVVIDKLNKPILGRYVGEKPRIGQRVRVEFEDVGEQSVYVFKPED